MGTTRRTELAHRTSDGLNVYLFWNAPTSRVTVSVLDARTDESFEFETDGRHALDAFNHPYAYAAVTATAAVDRLAASSGTAGNSHGATINPRRNNHARTDR